MAACFSLIFQGLTSVPRTSIHYSVAQITHLFHRSSHSRPLPFLMAIIVAVMVIVLVISLRKCLGCFCMTREHDSAASPSHPFRTFPLSAFIPHYTSAHDHLSSNCPSPLFSQMMSPFLSCYGLCLERFATLFCRSSTGT